MVNSPDFYASKIGWMPIHFKGLELELLATPDEMVHT